MIQISNRKRPKANVKISTRTSTPSLEYEDRLRELNLPSLLYRRTRGDLIEVYKLLNGHYNVEIDKYVIRSKETRTRGHNLKLSKQTCRLRARKHLFLNRVVDQWNCLPENIVTAPSINTFKNRLDKALYSLKFETNSSSYKESQQREQRNNKH